MQAVIKDLAKRSKTISMVAHILRGVRSIESLRVLDDFLADHGKRYPILDDKALDELSRISFRINSINLPRDPLSVSYRERVMEIYREISGRTEHRFDFEAAQFDPETEKFNFFPFNSNSTKLVGTQLITQGQILQNISLRPGSSIVELGAGQGNTALNLALTGYQVAVVEVNQPSIDLIKYRAKVHGREIRTFQQDMTEFVCTASEKFDAVLFVASFHHCKDHAKLLENINRIMNKGGVIYFADEPIFYSENRFLPYPWGLRLDGQSLYFIRRNGWLELGFQFKYLEKILKKFGWKIRTVRSQIPGSPNFFEASRLQ